MTIMMAPERLVCTSFQQPKTIMQEDDSTRASLLRATRAERRRTIRNCLSPRTSHHTKRSSKRTGWMMMTTRGSIVPSDIVYVDHFLTPEDTTAAVAVDMNEVYLYSDQDRQFCANTKTFRIKYRHVLRYKGDIVWQLETTCHGSDKGTRGESSYCRLYQNSLRVRIRRKTPDVSVGCCSTTTTSSRTERQTLQLFDILRQSAEEYQSEASSSSSFGGDDPFELFN